MKKLILMFIAVFSLLFIAACASQSNQAPEIKGANLTPTVEKGDAYDPLEGVTVDDDRDDLTVADIQVRGFDVEDLN